MSADSGGIAVVIPWGSTCPHRRAALTWVRHRYQSEFPEWKVVLAEDPAGGVAYSKTRAIVAGVRSTAADVFVIADADVWCDGVAAAVARVAAGRQWMAPHNQVRRLDQPSTSEVLAGVAPSREMGLDRKIYTGVVGGGMVVLTREAFETAPPDPRFEGWGGEDIAWGCALKTLVGPGRRGRDPLWHLWHPPEPRDSLWRGNPTNEALRALYVRVSNRPPVMAQVIAEGRQ